MREHSPDTCACVFVSARACLCVFTCEYRFILDVCIYIGVGVGGMCGRRSVRQGVSPVFVCMRYCCFFVYLVCSCIYRLDKVLHKSRPITFPSGTVFNPARLLAAVPAGTESTAQGNPCDMVSPGMVFLPRHRIQFGMAPTQRNLSCCTKLLRCIRLPRAV